MTAARRRVHPVVRSALESAFPAGAPDAKVVEARDVRHEKDGSRYGVGWVRLGDRADFGSAGGAAWVDVDVGDLPDVVTSSLAGRNVTDLVSHPWLEGLRIAATRRTSSGLRAVMADPSGQ